MTSWLRPFLAQLSISPKGAGTIRFDRLWPAQERIVAEVERAADENRPCRIIILKARQMGISTVSEALLFAHAIAYPATTGVVVAHDLDSTRILFGHTKLFYDSYPYRRRYPTKASSTRRLELKNTRSSIEVLTAGARTVGLGRRINHLHLSEMSLWRNTEDLYGGLRQAVPDIPRSIIVIESCVTGDALVMTDGGPTPIRDLVPDPERRRVQPTSVRVVGRFGRFEEATSAFVNGRTATRRVRTRYGFGLEATLGHPVLVLDDGRLEWRQARDLKTGDYLCVSYRTAGFGSDETGFVPSAKRGTRGNTDRFAPDEITTDLAYLIGLYLAEGYASKKPVRTVITSGDEEIHGWLAETFGFVRKDRWHSWWFRRDFIDLLDHLGLDTRRRAPEKTIPDRLMRLSKSSTRALLQGMFDGDGSIHARRRCVSYVTTSEAMARRLQVLLLSFGVVARRYARPAAPGGQIAGRTIRSRRDVHTLEITGPFYDAFMDQIGFRLGRKQASRSAAPTRGTMIPGMWQALRKTLVGYGRRDALFRRVGFRPNKSYYRAQEMASETFARLVQAGADLDPEIGEYFYDPVVALEDGEAETFDLTVPGSHAFVGNGIVSHNTAKGLGNLFEQMWTEAESGRNEYTPIFLPWFDHPEYLPCGGACENGTCATCVGHAAGVHAKDDDERDLVKLGCGPAQLAWRRWAVQNRTFGNVDLFKEMFPARSEEAFISSGINAFPEAHIRRCYVQTPWQRGRLQPDPTRLGHARFLDDPNGPLRVYKRPGAGQQYFLGADACFGHGPDRAAAHVINRESKEQVAVWHGKINPIAFADECAALASFYNRATIAGEVFGPGTAFISRLQAVYPNLWMQVLPDRAPGRDRSNVMVGFATNWRTKAWLVANLANMLERGEVVLHDRPTYGELRSYVWYGASDQFGPAQGAGHDDLVMALGICLLCESTSPAVPPDSDGSGWAPAMPATVGGVPAVWGAPDEDAPPGWPRSLG